MLLAQGSQVDWSAVSQLGIGLGVIIAVVIAAYVVIGKLKGRLIDDQAQADAPLQLHDFREMHARGQLTDEEYENLRASFTAGIPKTNDLRAEVERRRTAQRGDGGRADSPSGS